MTSVIKPGTLLTCGCCGSYFETWLGYEDQDQGDDWGICARCQKAIEQKYEHEMDAAITTLAAGLNEKNRAKLLSYPRKRQEELVMWAIEKGHLTWTIAPGH